MTPARALPVLLAATGCFTSIRTSFPDGGSGAAGDNGAGGQPGMGSGIGGGQSGVAGSGTGGSNPVFVGGPCIVTPDRIGVVEVFARASDGHIYRRAYDGRNWGSWVALAGLDGTMIDARSDLECDASQDTIHIVATGINPPGALLHAFGFGTSYNPFTRELSSLAVPQSPAIVLSGSGYYMAWAGISRPPALYYLEAGAYPIEFTPITSLANALVSGVDMSRQSSNVLVAAYDSAGYLAIYPLNLSSAGAEWSATPASLPAPSGVFALNPTICSESGASGSFSINVAAMAGTKLWFAGTARIPVWPEFSQWQVISTEATSSPDCVVLRETPTLEAVIHVVTLGPRGTVLDVQGNGASWATTDLGSPF